MGKVNTVLGTSYPEELGITLMHEHLLFGYHGYEGDASCSHFDMEEAYRACCTMVSEMKNHGVQTIIDATPNDCGREPEFMARVSSATGVNVICATGYYNETWGGSAYFKMRSITSDVEEEIYELMKREVTEGIRKTGIKAGVIKLASSRERITEYELPFFKAAARVQKEDGIPIITHTESGSNGLAQLTLLTERGASADKIVIGHMCDNADIEAQLAVINKGAFVGFDRFAVEGILDSPYNAQKENLLEELLREGYSDRIVLSHDFVMQEMGRGSSLAHDGRKRYLTIFEQLIPKLIDDGISVGGIRRMLVDNIKKIFL